MIDDEKSRLVNGWIAMYKHYGEKGTNDEFFWAFEELDSICKSSPQLAWEIILRILETYHSESIMENLAAGPLEDLLVYYGEDIIDLVELRAERDPLFKELLGGVWKNTISGDVWKRVQNLVETNW